GVRIGSYEITAKLGEGGMGEVWRATDTKLQREVAIKVLPAEFTADAERLARFEREAQLLAQLQHPNIASIYGLEESNGTRALVLELVEGPTLAERLEAGPLSIEESLTIARQILEALEEAHEKGIVHRDLKPQNIKASGEGKAKVLDFGLAKAMEATPGSASAVDLARSPTLMNSPTLTAVHGTQLGMILGTAAYMAPEQARGAAVDKRADIWAFGVLLHEMLTGVRLFEGESVVDTLSAVMRQEIDLNRLPAGTPGAIRQLLRRCLERSPKNRLHDIADARIVIEDILAGRADEVARATPAAPPTNPWPMRLAWLAGGAALGALALIGFRAPAKSAREAAGGGESRPFALRRLTELPGAELQPTLSPDGRMIVYASAAAGNLDLYLLRVGGDRAIALTTDPADDSRAAFSPDGERIAFRSERDGGGLFVMGATGESVRRVTDAGFDPSWSPDGRRLVYATEEVFDPVSRDGNSELWIVEVDSGGKTLLSSGDAVQPAWSRQGDRIAYWANTQGQRDLWTVAAAGGEPVVVTRDAATDWSPEWSPDGRWLHFASDRGGSYNLWRVEIDPATGGAAGLPQPVTTGVRGMGYPRFASDGSRLSAMAYERNYEQTIYAVDTTPAIAGVAGVRLRPLRTLRNPSARWCALSPDGASLACNTASAPEDIVVVRADGSEMRRLTSDLHKDRTPLWDPAGRRLSFYSTRSGRWEYWSIGADGSDMRRQTEIGDFWSGSWMPGDQGFVVQLESTMALLRLDAKRLETAATASAVPAPPASERFVAYSWSHAGDRVAGAALDATGGGAKDLAIWTPASGTYRRLDLAVNGRGYGSVAGWLPGDRGLVARTSEGVVLIDVASGESRVIAPASADAYVSLSGDGRTLSVENEILDSDIWLLEFE
ncbi:MAG: eukaryotic-like serine/threonine-protein kinase, partial [Acidobacteriota bacterium]|nr:eukaryotic-like serine/threonine-protein kinase [Acidobacteriota bacterium]